jgi:hypothetical protein
MENDIKAKAQKIVNLLLKKDVGWQECDATYPGSGYSGGAFSIQVNGYFLIIEAWSESSVALEREYLLLIRNQEKETICEFKGLEKLKELFVHVRAIVRDLDGAIDQIMKQLDKKEK